MSRFNGTVVFLSVILVLLLSYPDPVLCFPRNSALTPSQKYLDSSLRRTLRDLSLTFDTKMTEKTRLRDYQRKIRKAYKKVGIKHLYELRERSEEILSRNHIPWSWERFRRLKTKKGVKLGVWLTIPVWIPRGSIKIRTCGGFKKKWEDVESKDRFLGYIYFTPSLKDVNDKRHYHAGRLTFETSRYYAPFAYLFFQYIFREGMANYRKRVPIVSVRSGEDTYAAVRRAAPQPISCVEFPDEVNGDLRYRIISKKYDNYADIIHGHHKGESNHRIGCAFDINSFDFPDVKDGSPNPISRAKRQFHRDRLHAIDARNLPLWVYKAAEEIGFRVPYTWSYGWGFTDWHHFDCGRVPKLATTE